MVNRVKRNILMYFFMVIFFNLNFYNLNSGSDFVAISIPSQFYDYLTNITNYAKNSLTSKNRINNPKILPVPSKNLHITLKEIGELNNKERAIVIKKLNKISSYIEPRDITQAVKKAKLKIDNNSIKLMLKEHNCLTNIADRIDSALRDLVAQGKIRFVKFRLDFPKNGHITLAEIRNMPKDFENKIKNIENNFKNNFNQRFLINQFDLFQSNSPKKPRIYSKKAQFNLKKIETYKPCKKKAVDLKDADL